VAEIWRIAGVQFEPQLGQKEANLERIGQFAARAAEAGARLAIFPECAVCGYCFESLEEAAEYAEPIPGPATERLADLCRRRGLFVVAGMLERAEQRVFNACVLVGPNGLVGSYRKIHLPHLGVDRFATPGDRPFQVWQIDGLRVGMHICYDGSFPESARVMTLAGADLIALPTNWPTGSECSSEHMVATRAMENTVYYAAVNRIGVERGVRFIGGSRICDPEGRTLAAASANVEAVLYAEIDPEQARRKLLVRVPEKHHINRMADRRPQFYGPIIEPVTEQWRG